MTVVIEIGIAFDRNQNCNSSTYFTVSGCHLKNEIRSPRNTTESMECKAEEESVSIIIHYTDGRENRSERFFDRNIYYLSRQFLLKVSIRINKSPNGLLERA